MPPPLLGPYKKHLIQPKTVGMGNDNTTATVTAFRNKIKTVPNMTKLQLNQSLLEKFNTKFGTAPVTLLPQPKPKQPKPNQNNPKRTLGWVGIIIDKKPPPPPPLPPPPPPPLGPLQKNNGKRKYNLKETQLRLTTTVGAFKTKK
jgi:hypothetical protein